MKAKVSELLSKVYKAKDCTDVNDVEFALSECWNIYGRYGTSRALMNRINSLDTKRIKLKSKTH